MTGDYNAFSRRSGIIVVGVLRIYNTDSCYLRKLSPAKERKKIMSNKCSCTALHHNKKREGVTKMFWHVFAAVWNMILFDAF